MKNIHLEEYESLARKCQLKESIEQRDTKNMLKGIILALLDVDERVDKLEADKTKSKAESRFLEQCLKDRLRSVHDLHILYEKGLLSDETTRAINEEPQEPQSSASTTDFYNLIKKNMEALGIKSMEAHETDRGHHIVCEDYIGRFDEKFI